MLAARPKEPHRGRTPGRASAWVAPVPRNFAVTSPFVAMQVRAGITGTVWKIVAKVGDQVEEEQTLAILESMKMEIPVLAPCAGRVAQVAVVEGAAVEDDSILFHLE